MELKKEKGVRPFRFEPHWVHEEECANKIKEVWQRGGSVEASAIAHNLNCMAAKLKQ